MKNAWLGSLRDSIMRLTGSSVEERQRFIKGCVLAGVVSISGIGAFFGYQWRETQNRRMMQMAFFDCSQAADKSTAGDIASIEYAKRLIDDAIAQYGTSSYGSFFHLLNADLHLKQDDHAGAVSAVKQARQEIAQTSPLSGLVGLRYALMLLDSTVATEQEQGVQELQTLANNEQNTHRDAALFYVGYYHWVKDDVDQARVAWNTLVREYYDDTPHSSIWAQTARGFIVHMPPKEEAQA